MEENSLYYSTPTMDFQGTLPWQIQNHSYEDNADASVKSFPPLGESHGTVIHQQSLPLHTQCLNIRHLNAANR